MDADDRTRLAVLEQRVSDLDRAIDRIERDLGDMRRELASAKESFDKGLADVKDALGRVMVGALNSLPPWGAKFFIFAGVLVGALAALAAAAFRLIP